jgi:hypothetical protein
MKFSAAAVIATVAGAHAYAYGNGTAPVPSSSSAVEYTTEVVTKVTTYCPGPTEVTYGGETYTVTEPGYLTITKCPGGCTISYPVHTVTPGYGNSTAPVPYPTGTVPTTTGAAPTYPVESAPPIATAGAGKTVALSGAALAGVLGFAVLL